MPHPDLAAEQAHVDHAYERLAAMRANALAMLRAAFSERGGTFQATTERDIRVRTSLNRLEQLQIGRESLVFGRIDRLASSDGRGPETGRTVEAASATADDRPAGVGGDTEGVTEAFHIGRLAVADEDQEPLVVDWRAPVAEPYYRATGAQPMGLARRRHFLTEGQRVLDLEDELFGDAEHGEAGDVNGIEAGLGAGLSGSATLLATLSRSRTGRMRDIVATVQREQDEIIRGPLSGVLVVQGGPGTGKTAVALHRAAYLLYTHRFPLERQGVLVIGPNPLFLRYIEHVLPSLGESGVTLSTVNGLVHGLLSRAEEPAAVARLKGEARMSKVVARAVRSRQRPLRRTVTVPYGSGLLHLTPAISAEVVSAARRRPGSHNARRRFVEQLVVRRLADEYLRTLAVHGVGGGADEEDGPAERRPALLDGPGTRRSEDDEAAFDVAEFGAQLRRLPQFAEALDRMWPRLSAEELLHDLFGAPALLSLAANGILSQAEQAALVRPRHKALADIPWSPADLALVDEARVLLGPRRPRRAGSTGAEPDEPRTYGHIVVDEAQDLSPMQLRMVARRSLSGSITVVGDIAQATGPWAPRSWDEVTAHLPAPRAPRLVELTVSYRTPAEVVEVAGRVLAEAVPGMQPPTAVRRTGVAPRIVAAAPGELADVVAAEANELVAELAPGTAAVLAPGSLVADLSIALDRAGVRASDPRHDGLGAPLSLLPVDLANGLEFDAVVVVEP